MFQVVVRLEGGQVFVDYPAGKHALAALVLKDAYELCLKVGAQADLQAARGVQPATAAQVPPVPPAVQRRINGG